MAMRFWDVHTHAVVQKSDGASVCAIVQTDKPADFPCSIGVHPYSPEPETAFDALLPYFADPHVMAVGETGIDLVRGGVSPAEQEALFIRHIHVANELNKPLIVHCVRAYDRFMVLRKQGKTPWIFHRFSGSVEAAIRLSKADCYFSFSPRNIDAPIFKKCASFPILLETDDDNFDIRRHYERAAHILNLPLPALCSRIDACCSVLFPGI